MAPLLVAIKGAKSRIDIVVFRFDRSEIEAALKSAVVRGVSVNALIAYANRGGEKNLRKLEMRLLDAGVTVSRTSSDLSRYHDKLILIDNRELYVLSFNFTHLDIDHSRGFGIVTRKQKFVQEARKLIEADSNRHSYEAGQDTFVVSPVNARKQLAAFIRGATKELQIYDPNIGDAEMLRLLNDRAKSGVAVHIIGTVSGKHSLLEVRKPTFRLHTRTIIRDRRTAFVGSQSLRQAELDSRREVGVIIADAKTVAGLLKTFEADWALDEAPSRMRVPVKKLKKSVKAAMEPLSAKLTDVLEEVVAGKNGDGIDPEEVKETVQKAVKQAVKEQVEEILSKTTGK